jgi:hypothetical protein
LTQKGSRIIDGKKVPNIRIVPWNNGFHDIWNLPDSNKVYEDFCKGSVETVFQFDAFAARAGLRHFMPHDGVLPLNSIDSLSVFTALDRPGPLDAYVTDENGKQHNMLVEYANRSKGLAPVGNIPVFDELLPESFGVLCFQEGLQYVFQKVGGTTGIEANNFRNRISKKKLLDVEKKDKPLFMKGAVEKYGLTTANMMWDQMVTFGQYGFNASHAVSYVTISYACAFLKRYFPLEWWTGVLSNASRKEIDERFWKYVSKFMLLPDIQKSGKSFQIEGDKIRAPIWLVNGIGEKAQQLMNNLAPFSDISDMLRKIEAYKVNNATKTVKIDELTGEQKISVRKAHCALNDSIIKKLIICGVMNSLFPDQIDGLPMTTVDRLKLFEIEATKARGLKKYKGSASKFLLDSATAQYQYHKSILPAYSAPLVPLLSKSFPDLFEISPKRQFFKTQKDSFMLVNGKQYEWLAGLEMLPPSVVQVALPVYIVETRTFQYTQKKTKERVQAIEITADCEGSRVSMVKWPQNGKLPAAFLEELVGSIGILTLERSDATKPFFLIDYQMLVTPLQEKKEESSG